MDPIPWQASLGISGGAVSLALGTLTWVVRQLVTGKFQSKAQVDAQIAAITVGNDKLIALEHQRASEAIAAETLGRSEWRDTALAERTGRIEMQEIARKAVDSSKLADHFFDTYMPPRSVRQKEDNVLEGSERNDDDRPAPH